MRYKLHTPIKASTGRVLAEVELRDHLTAGDIIESRRVAIDKNDSFETSLNLIARVAGLDYKLEAPQLDMRDVDAIDAHIGRIRAPKAPTDSEMSIKSLPGSETA